MAWEWSHTDAGIANARANLFDKDMDWLVEVYAEWKCADLNADEDRRTTAFLDGTHEVIIEEVTQWGYKDGIAAYIWSRAEEERTCDNGGFNAWMCPDGCHTVPFSRVCTKCGEQYDDDDGSDICTDCYEEED